MKFEELAFVKVTSDGECSKVAAWEPVRSDDYTTDNKTGRAYFDALHGLLLDSGNQTFLSRVLAAQVRGGVWEGVEIGFAQAMAEKLMLA